jgi:hypothetical protein
MITGILNCINSRADMYGNRYWAFKYTDSETGKTVMGKISGGESNVYSIVREMGQTSETVHYFRTMDVPIREYNRLVKTWEYAGCRPEELVSFIHKALYSEDGAQ